MKNTIVCIFYVLYTYSDLRFQPLFDVRLFDFKVHTFNAFTTSEDFDPAQERLEIVQNTARCLEESRQSKHVDRKTNVKSEPKDKPKTKFSNYLGSFGMCSDKLVNNTARLNPISLAGSWN